ncbi:MAG: XRE family transcriptional regulator [Peptococcaceae bacterium]|nr:MAG: XRE family transcriptional regulator [Peptococcaceae bacterium]
MVVNTTALKSLAWEKGWSIPELAKRLGIDYSYLFRVINGEKKGGANYSLAYTGFVGKKTWILTTIFFLATLLTTDNINYLNVKNKSDPGSGIE